ncbi:hypothetical protein R6Q59_027521 [Mikania micrantha]
MLSILPTFVTEDATGDREETKRCHNSGSGYGGLRVYTTLCPSLSSQNDTAAATPSGDTAQNDTPPDLRVHTSALIVYDIFWVFFTPVMVNVAKSFDVSCIYQRIFVALALRYDVTRQRKPLLQNYFSGIYSWFGLYNCCHELVSSCKDLVMGARSTSDRA